MNSNKYHELGITLTEIMIGLAIVGILLMSVGPSVREILIRNRMIGQINELSAVIQFARHTAINEQIDAVVCPTTNFSTCTTEWNDPKMVFIDLDGNGQRSSDEEMLAGSGNIIATNDLTGPNGTISFQASGAVASPATLLLCHEDNEAKYARALTISLQGRVKLSEDSNRDGVHEDNSGNALSCGS